MQKGHPDLQSKWSVPALLEDISMQLATARTNTAMLSKEMRASVDPDEAAKHVQEIFAGFSKPPKAEQRVILEKWVAKIIYHEPQIIGAENPDFSSLEVKMRLPEDTESDTNTEGGL
jgi:hypothetical protein